MWHKNHTYLHTDRPRRISIATTSKYLRVYMRSSKRRRSPPPPTSRQDHCKQNQPDWASFVSQHEGKANRDWLLGQTIILDVYSPVEHHRRGSFPSTPHSSPDTRRLGLGPALDLCMSRKFPRGLGVRQPTTCHLVPGTYQPSSNQPVVGSRPSRLEPTFGRGLGDRVP